MSRVTIKWKIAELINKLPNTCWSGLVRWVYSEITLWQLVTRHKGNEYCLRDKDSCYCGKLNK